MKKHWKGKKSVCYKLKERKKEERKKERWKERKKPSGEKSCL